MNATHTHIFTHTCMHTHIKDDFDTVSKQKYYNMIQTWGGWDLFQDLLASLKTIGMCTCMCMRIHTYVGFRRAEVGISSLYVWMYVCTLASIKTMRAYVCVCMLASFDVLLYSDVSMCIRLLLWYAHKCELELLVFSYCIYMRDYSCSMYIHEQLDVSFIACPSMYEATSMVSFVHELNCIKLW